MRTPFLFHRLPLLLVASTALASCGAFAPDDDRYDRLNELRVLAIQSSPADLAFGETTTLSANVYEPDERDISYEWSWCPSRADGTGGFECSIDEDVLQLAWANVGSDGDAPSYDLGNAPEAQFTHRMTPQLVGALCQAIAGSDTLDEQLLLACFMGLQASIKLTVRTSKEEVTAIRALPLLTMATAEAERNANPPSNFTLQLRDKETKAVVKDGQSLEAGHSYTVIADLDEAIAQTFTPTALPGESAAEERRETLIMSWFLTTGSVVPAEDDSGFTEGDVRSTFVDGSNEFEDVTKNGWQLPLTAGSDAEIHVVLRDERGGVGWTSQRFAVTGGEK